VFGYKYGYARTSSYEYVMENSEASLGFETEEYLEEEDDEYESSVDNN
jgi:hypothetical protein